MKFENYWRNLSKYEIDSLFFELEFFKDLQKCKIDYSLISLNILERDKREEYKKKKSECPNCEKKIVYLTSKINPFSSQNEEHYCIPKKEIMAMDFIFYIQSTISLHIWIEKKMEIIEQK